MNSSAEVLTQAANLVKAVTGLIPSAPTTASKGTRGGPLQTLARLYLSLTLILAVSSSVTTYLDKEAPSTCFLRYLLAGVVVVGLIGALLLVAFLFKRGPFYLLSPTEYSQDIHVKLVGKEDLLRKGTVPDRDPIAEPPAAPATPSGES